MKFVAAAVLFAILQTPSPQTGGVEGVVLRAGTNQPIEGVELRLSPVTPQPGRDGPLPATDRDGRFSAAGLVPGRYLVMAVKSGYAAQIYGAGQTGIAGLAGIGTREEDLAAAGALIDVVSGQVVRNVVIRMTPSATVGGRVLGTNGEPLVGMQVELLPVTFDASGRRSLIALTQVDTNDRGEYRLFSVEPGRYYISARWSAVAIARQEVNSELRTVDAADSNGQRYAPAYYPGSPDLAHAAVVEVKSGDTLSPLDVVMRPPTPQVRRKIRGRVLDSTTGQAPPENSGSSFLLIPRDAEYLNSLPAWDDPHLMADGTFELRDVAEGNYWLVVRLTSARRSEGPPPGTTAVMPLVVVGGDIEGLVVSLLPATTLSGKASLDGVSWSAADPGGFQIRLTGNRIGPFTMNGAANPSPAFFQPDGMFTITNVNPGEYDLVFNGLPPDTYVREARYGSVDALTQKIVINSANPNSLEVDLSTKSGQLVGVVMDRDRKPAQSAEAVLIPEGVRRPDRYKTARTDASGRFLMRGIAPGNYRIYAWESLERFRYFDEEFVRQFEGIGKSIRVEESARLTIDLDMIPAAK